MLHRSSDSRRKGHGKPLSSIFSTCTGRRWLRSSFCRRVSVLRRNAEIARKGSYMEIKTVAPFIVLVRERSRDPFREHAVYNNNNLARFSRNRENSIKRHYRTTLPSIRRPPSLPFALNFGILGRTWPGSFMLRFPRERSRAICSHL